MIAAGLSRDNVASVHVYIADIADWDVVNEACAEFFGGHKPARVIVLGNRDHCTDVCREKVEKEGVYYANHVYNPFFYEGTKTYIYETYEQLGRILEHIFVPVGNGTLFIGVMKGLEELLNSGAIDHMPQVVAVQGITIPEDKILSAREKIARQGIYCEHTMAAVYAGYEHYCERYGKPDEALLSMCGAGLKSDHA